MIALLAAAYLPALGFQIGQAIAEFFEPPPWLLGAMLHAAAGIALAVVALELTPRSFAVGPLGPTLLAFSFGAGVSIAVSRLTKRLRTALGAGKGALTVYSVATVDLLSDGLMTGAGAAAASTLALLLGGSQVVANVPSGFASGAQLRKSGAGAALRLGLGAAAAVPALGAALLGWAFLRGQPQAIQATALAGVAGLLLAATVEDLIPAADRPQSPRSLSTCALAGGFVLLAWTARIVEG